MRLSSLMAKHISPDPSIMSLPRVLTIQSHTVSGYVGNKAATFPLQCLGFHVDAINTVTLSNHPAYSEGCRGSSLEPDEMAELVEGLKLNNMLHYDSIVSGYMRSEELLAQTAEAVRAIRAVNPNAAYICDPVLGDGGDSLLLRLFLFFKVFIVQRKVLCSRGAHTRLPKYAHSARICYRP